MICCDCVERPHQSRRRLQSGKRSARHEGDGNRSQTIQRSCTEFVGAADRCMSGLVRIESLFPASSTVLFLRTERRGHRECGPNRKSESVFDVNGPGQFLKLSREQLLVCTARVFVATLDKRRSNTPTYGRTIPHRYRVLRVQKQAISGVGIFQALEISSIWMAAFGTCGRWNQTHEILAGAG